MFGLQKSILIFPTQARLATPHNLDADDIAIKELVTDGNLDCSDEGIVSLFGVSDELTYQALQAMDNSHVALVSLKLVADQFESYRCDRNIPLGVNVSILRLSFLFAPVS